MTVLNQTITLMTCAHLRQSVFHTKVSNIYANCYETRLTNDDFNPKWYNSSTAVVCCSGQNVFDT